MKCPQGLLLHQSGSLNALGWSQVENGYELRCFYLYTHLCVQEINSVCFVSYFAILKFDHHNLALRNNITCFSQEPVSCYSVLLQIKHKCVNKRAMDMMVSEA